MTDNDTNDQPGQRPEHTIGPPCWGEVADKYAEVAGAGPVRLEVAELANCVRKSVRVKTPTMVVVQS